jgi:hypothetical protein
MRPRRLGHRQKARFTATRRFNWNSLLIFVGMRGIRASGRFLTKDEFLEQYPTVSRKLAVAFLEQASERLLATA